MKSITIHGIDSDLDQKIAEKSAEFGLSQNKTIKTILHESLLSDKKMKRKENYSQFVGIWNNNEKEEFNKAIKDCEEINVLDWKK